MKKVLLSLFIVVAVCALCSTAYASINTFMDIPRGKAKIYNSNFKNHSGGVDLADVQSSSNLYLPKNYIYTYKEALSTKKRLEDQLQSEPNSLGIRWALMRYFVSASNFVGGCNAKALEQARSIYDVDDYIGCMAYEFVYTRLHRFDKAEEWYRRSLIIAQQKPNFDLMDITYNKTVQSSIKTSGSFNSEEPNHLYEGNDGVYNRKVLLAKNKSTAYKLLIDYRTTIARN